MNRLCVCTRVRLLSCIAWHTPCLTAGMDTAVLSQVDFLIRAYLVPIAWKFLGALVVWVVGSWGIRIIRGALQRVMRMRQFDSTLARYLDASLDIVLKMFMLIAILGVLGIETTSFAALLAAAGIAVGAAWSGLLANFAAGLFLLTFRPFRVGDTISAAGVTGTVREIGLFMTSIDTPDQVLTYVGNNKLFADNVQNFSANPCRRVELTAPLRSGTDVDAAILELREQVQRVPHVIAAPETQIELLAVTATGPVLTVRPYCHHEHYWQVYFDTNRIIARVCH